MNELRLIKRLEQEQRAEGRRKEASCVDTDAHCLQWVGVLVWIGGPGGCNCCSECQPGERMFSDNWPSLSPLHPNATALESHTTIKGYELLLANPDAASARVGLAQHRESLDCVNARQACDVCRDQRGRSCCKVKATYVRFVSLWEGLLLCTDNSCSSITIAIKTCDENS